MTRASGYHLWVLTIPVIQMVILCIQTKPSCTRRPLPKPIRFPNLFPPLLSLLITNPIGILQIISIKLLACLLQLLHSLQMLTLLAVITINSVLSGFSLSHGIKGVIGGHSSAAEGVPETGRGCGCVLGLKLSG